MAIKKTWLHNYEAWMDTNNYGKEIRASYTERYTLLDAMDHSSRDDWYRYWDALVAWVAQETGIPHYELWNCRHRGHDEPYLCYVIPKKDIS